MEKTFENLKTRVSESAKSDSGRRIFTDDLKRDVVAYHRESGKSIYKMASELGVSIGALANWVKKFDTGSFQKIEILPTADNRSHSSSMNKLRIIGPEGFAIEGDLETICLIWRKIHATAI